MPARPRGGRPRRGDDSAAALAELAGIEASRARLDAREVTLVEQARQAGATWTAIAGVWGLTSRQAAEQRFLRLSERLARQAARAREPADTPFGPDILALRRAAADLLHALRAEQRWTSRSGRTALAHATVRAAVEGPPGALYHLLIQAVADIDTGAAGADAPGADAPGADAPGAGAPPTGVRRALEGARQAIENATPH